VTAQRVNYSAAKFKELILYFAKRGLDENLVIGSTKLNKLLFFSDFRAYAKLGTPITGARYQKLEWGPAPRALLPVRAELVEDGEATFRDSEDWNQVLQPLREPDMSVFTDEELFVIDEVFDELRQFNATSASDYSHTKSAGWNAAEEFEDIPYDTARINTDRPPEHVFEFFRELHAEHADAA
jgi:hypothetical protein